MNYENDIPLSLAIAAHSGSSFVPERRGESEQQDFAQTMARDLETFRQHAIKGGTLASLDAEFASYREGYAKRTRAYLASRSRCVSWMIAGPSKFPAARMEKRSNIAHKRLTELLEYAERARKAVIRNLRPDLRPIMSGDSDACERLRAELTKAEAIHARMTAVNKAHKAYLKNPASLDKSGLSDADKARVINYNASEHYSWEPHPFPPYSLSNSNANIRRMRERLATLEATKAAPTVEHEGSAARLEDDPPANRVRLFFPGKPDESVRSRLKSSGFRWSPSIGAWQAYSNARTLEIAQQVAA